MTFPEEELPDVGAAPQAVVKEAQDSGVWGFGGGPHSYEEVSAVATDRTVSDGPYPENKAYIGGFSVVEVPSREKALEWAAKIAIACRCDQDVRELVPGSRPLVPSRKPASGRSVITSFSAMPWFDRPSG